jgi:hypothetical protein
MEWTLILVVVIGLASLFAAYKIGGSTKEGRIDTLARALDSEVERAESLTKALAAMENSRNQQAWARKEQVTLTTKATDERDELIRALDECTKHAGREVERPGDGGPPDWLESALALVAKYKHYVPDIIGDDVTGDGAGEALHTDFLMENNPKGRVPRDVHLSDSDDITPNGHPEDKK